MAIINTAVTYSGKDATEIFTKPIVTNPLIQQIGLEIVDDVQSLKKLYFQGNLRKITKKRVGCGWVETGTGTNLFTKNLAVTDLQVQLPQCAAVFDQTIWESLRKKGYDINNLEGTQLQEMLVDAIEIGAIDDYTRIMWFGDTASADTDYNQLDGFFKVLAAAIAGDGVKSTGALADNAMGTNDAAIAALQAVYFAATPQLKALPNASKVFLVSGSVYENFQQSLIRQGNLESARTALLDGTPTLTYMGVEIIPMYQWDSTIAADFSPTANPDRPHRIIFAERKNLIVGLDTVSDNTDVMFWYEPKDDMNYARIRYKLGVTYKFPEMIAVGGLV